MGVIVLTDPVAGTLADATVVANNNAAIKAAINGGIDNNNFAAGKIFDPSKIMQNGATASQVLAWNGSIWAPATPASSGAVFTKYGTLVDLVSSVSETDLLQAAGYVVAGNAMGALGMVRVTLIGDLKNNSGGAVNFTPRIYWGGSTYFDNGAFSIANSTVRSPFRIELTIANLNATGTQFIEGVFHNIGTPTAVANAGIGGVSSEFRFGSNGTAAQDTTTAKTIRVTGQFGTSSALVELRVYQSLIEIL